MTSDGILLSIPGPLGPWRDEAGRRLGSSDDNEQANVRPAERTYSLVTAARKLGVDGVELVRMIGLGEISTCRDYPDLDEPRVSQVAIDRWLASRNRRRRASRAVHQPARPHVLVPDTHEVDEETQRELARLLGNDPDRVAKAARRLRG